jgi:hypothetical protein
MCINKSIEDLMSLSLMLLEQTKDECYECRQPCEEEDENETWQYFTVDGYKYCYSCWEELELEKQL